MKSPPVRGHDGNGIEDGNGRCSGVVLLAHAVARALDLIKPNFDALTKPEPSSGGGFGFFFGVKLYPCKCSVLSCFGVKIGIYMGAMYIESIRNRNSPPAVLLRESYRDNGKVCKRTLANLSCLSGEVIDGLKVLLRGGVAVASGDAVFVVERSLPHGHVAAVLGSARRAGAALWFGSAPEPLQPLLLAMLVARVTEPASKLATHRQVHDDTASSSLGRVLGVGQCSVEELYRALDWLAGEQSVIERRLARQHQRD